MFLRQSYDVIIFFVFGAVNDIIHLPELLLDHLLVVLVLTFLILQFLDHIDIFFTLRNPHEVLFPLPGGQELVEVLVVEHILPTVILQLD